MKEKIIANTKNVIEQRLDEEKKQAYADIEDYKRRAIEAGTQISTQKKLIEEENKHIEALKVKTQAI